VRTGSQAQIDRANQRFWDELCGTSLARSLGITENTPESVARFDRAYLAYYPYLSRYVAAPALRGKRVLEIGLGYGTLGQILAGHAARYVGVDIAAGPAAMVRDRLARAGRGTRGTAMRGSALALPFTDGAFDAVYAIGCLHHTGDLGRAVSEVHRVLAPGGRATVTLYNRRSLRLLISALEARVERVTGDERRRREGAGESRRRAYDVNSQGEAAPHTEFVSRREARRLFRPFSRVRVETRNCDTYVLLGGRLVVPRARLLNTLGRLLGLDLYIVATKSRRC
jgi:SAM-dependent methyltransferase